MKRIIATALSAILICSCIRDSMDDCGNCGNDMNGSRTVPVEFTVETWADCGSTRSSLSVSEDAVKSINIYVYHDGRLESSIYSDNPQELSLDMFIGRQYNIYALANTGKVNPFQNESELISYRHTVGATSLIKDALSMAWSLAGYSVSNDSPKVSITLTRLLARVNFSVDLSSVSDLTITDVRLCQAALSISPFTEGSKASSTSEVGDGDYASAADLATLNAGGEICFYVPENCQGVLLPDNTDPWAKIPDEIPESSHLCTYLELTASYQAEYGGEEVSSDRMKYRFFLGADCCTDFNVIRNNDMNISLEITEDNVFEDCWKVEFGEDLPVIKFGLECTPAAVSIEAGSSTSVKAIYYRTADGARNWESNYTSYATWTSSNASVATVSKGSITGKTAGTATITATVGNSKATVTVTVTQTGKQLTGLSVESDKDEYTAGEYAYFTATASFSDGTTVDVTEDCSWDCWDDCLGTSTPGLFIAGQSDESGYFEIYAEYTYKGVTKSDSKTCDVIYPKEGISVSSTSVGWQEGSLTITINDPDGKGWTFTSDDDHFSMSGGSTGSGNTTRTLTYGTIYSGGSYTVYVLIGSKRYSATISRKTAPTTTYTVDYWCYATVSSAVNSGGNSGPGAAKIYFRLAEAALCDMTVYDNHGNAYTIAKGEYQSATKTVSFDYMPYDDLVPDFIYGTSTSPASVTTYDDYYGIVIYRYGFDY
ncbi:MAG: DUF4906 domain-containing protein [Bacteroidales bacterium]|nr:DUF4906 domain-containing protein [Bacteroidales bacterium]